ncbi:Ig-like domain-containing protein [Flavisolibacter nicotianae]|uniref:Ig-like domain-containing protein n=1 Tax=Flavisolibacter nicotianae TaxID=2364882 RepID=UPI000EB20CEE|nr:Ig-like domain-containing protein [Flavisolibacter nicotianae]
MTFFRTTILLLFTCLFFACSKNGSTIGTENTKDTTAPAITITSPTNNQIFSSGQTIQVTASATDNNKVSELHIHVLNKETGALLRDIHSYPDAKTGTVQDAFTAQTGLSYIIKIIAFDPSQNLATAQVDVSTN